MLVILTEKKKRWRFADITPRTDGDFPNFPDTVTNYEYYELEKKNRGVANYESIYSNNKVNASGRYKL